MNYYYAFIYPVIYVVIVSTVNAQVNQCSGNQCIPVTKCAPVLNFIRQKQKNLTEEERNYVRQLQCDRETSTAVKVCCPEALVIPETTETAALEIVTTTEDHLEKRIDDDDDDTDTSNSSSNLLPERAVCGKQTENRIIGGETAAIDEFSWMALLEYEIPSGSRRYFCGGSLINDRYVLTAAHCITSTLDGYVLKGVRLGEHTISHHEDCESTLHVEYCADPPLDFDLEEVIVHERYSPRNKNRAYDIALLRLNKTVNYTDFIKPICLPKPKELTKILKKETHVIVAGWGITDNNNPSDVKLKVQLPMVSNSDCFQIYQKRLSVRLNNTNQICAGGIAGKDSCRGDSGGPLMYLDFTDTEENYVLFGIVSFGIHCAAGDIPGVYTNVAAYYDWILDKIKP